MATFNDATFTQPKLRSMFCTLFLKMALSAAELMSFGHLGAAIFHRWTITSEVPSKISVTKASQRYYNVDLYSTDCNQYAYNVDIKLIKFQICLIHKSASCANNFLCIYEKIGYYEYIVVCNKIQNCSRI